MSDDCIFCKIAQGQIPGHVIYEDDEFLAMLDRFPSSPGHTLIIPKSHAADIFELDSETAGRLFQLAVRLAANIKDKLKCPGLNVLQNNGATAGQSVHHFHLHLIPRYEKDNVKIRWDTMDPTEEDFERIMKVLS